MPRTSFSIARSLQRCSLKPNMKPRNPLTQSLWVEKQGLKSFPSSSTQKRSRTRLRLRFKQRKRKKHNSSSGALSNATWLESVMKKPQSASMCAETSLSLVNLANWEHVHTFWEQTMMMDTLHLLWPTVVSYRRQLVLSTTNPFQTFSQAACNNLMLLKNSWEGYNHTSSKSSATTMNKSPTSVESQTESLTDLDSLSKSLYRKTL